MGKKCVAQIAGPILLVIGLGSVVFFAGFWGTMVDDMITDSVTEGRRIDPEDVTKDDWLTAPTYKDWANNNEKSYETETYTLYNLTNPNEVLLNGDKPNFEEVQAYKFKIVKHRFGEDGPGEPVKFHTRTDFADPYNQYGYTPSSTQETVRYHEYKTKEEIDADTARRLDNDDIWTLNPAWVIGPHSSTLADPNGFYSMAHVSASVLAPLHIVLVTATWPKLPATSQPPFAAYLGELHNTTGFDLGNVTASGFAVDAAAVQETFKLFGGDLLSELVPSSNPLSKICSPTKSKDAYLAKLGSDGPVLGELEMTEYNAATLLDPTSTSVENVDLCGFRELGALGGFISMLSSANATQLNAANHSLSWSGTSTPFDWQGYLLGTFNNNSALITGVLNSQGASLTLSRTQALIDKVYDENFVQRLKTLGFLEANAANLLVPNDRFTVFGEFGTDFATVAASNTAKRLETAYLRFVAPALAGDTTSLFSSTGQFTGDLSLKHGIFVKKKAREVLFGCMDKRNPLTNLYEAKLDFRVRGAKGSSLDGSSDYCTQASMWEPVFAGVEPMAGLALMTMGEPMPKTDAAYFATNPKPDEYVTGKQDLAYAGAYYGHNNISNTGSYWTLIETITSTHPGTVMAPLREDTRYDNTWVYLSDARRTLRFNYTKNTEFRGIKDLRRYELDPSHLQPNADMINPALLNQDGTPYTGAPIKLKTQYPSMAGDPKGILSLQRTLSAIGAAVPLALTMPHFFQSDFVAKDHFVGLSPDPEVHTSYLDFEPVTGSAVDAHKKIQFAVRLDKCFMDTGKYDKLFEAAGVSGYPTGGQSVCKSALNQATGAVIPTASVTTSTVAPTSGVLPLTPNVRMPWLITPGDYLHWPLGWFDQGGGATQKLADDTFTNGLYAARDFKDTMTIVGSVVGAVFIVAGLVLIVLGFKVWAGAKKVQPLTNLEEQKPQTTPTGGDQ